MVSLERIRVSPIASLGGVAIPEAELAGDGLAWDRRYAIVERPPEAGSDGESAGRPVDGVRERRLHALAVDYDLGRETVTVGPSGTDERHSFHLELNRACLATWLSEYVGYPVEVARDDEPWFPADANGPDRTCPTVVSTGTLEAVASWYDGIDVDELRRRLRPNLVVTAPAFWEDRLYGRPGRVVPIEIGPVGLQGLEPRQQSLRSTLDPDTGEETTGFRERFVERRKATLPEWASEARYDHYFRLMVDARVPEPSRGRRVTLGDPVVVGDAVADPTPVD